jgi:hypothetical protein
MMKKIILYIGLTILCLGSVDAFGQVMQTQPVSAILQILKHEGYISAQRIELINDEYQVNALDGEGEPVAIRINSHSGEIISMDKTDSHISMLEIVEKIEGVGYAGITFIEAKNSYYEVMAIGPDGKKSHLRVDAITGKISQEL